MYKPWIILFLLSGLLTSSQAQLVGRQVLELPLKYARPAESVVLSPVQSGKSQFFRGRPWIVYTDRAGVKSYQKPRISKKEVQATLGFMEGFYVVEDTEQFLHIVRDPDLKRGVLSIRVEDFGWVPKSQMLLWQSALGSAWSTQNPRQGIISNQKKPGKPVQFFLHPELKKKTEVNLEPQSYYLYKLDPQNASVLLGESPRMDRQDPGSTLLGWTELSNLIEKQNWLFCEPNWAPEVVNYRLENDYPLVAYRDSIAALHSALNSSVPRSSQLWQQDSLYSRRSGHWFRLPLLAWHEKVAKVAVFVPQTQTFRTGYLPLYIEEDSLRGVKFSLLLSRMQLVNLMTQMEKLKMNMPPGDARFEFKKVLWEMAQPYLEPEVSMPILSSWTFGQITEMIFGFPSQSALGPYRLRDLIDPELVSEEEIVDFLLNLDRKISELEAIFNTRSYKASFRSGSETFFWIEEDLLP
jgi:hypothetical protein